MVNKMKKLSVKFFLICAIIFLTIAHWIILIFRLPVFTSLPNWYWPFTKRDSLSILPLFFIIIISLFCLYFVLSILRQNKINRFSLIFFLLVFGICMHFGFLMLEVGSIKAIQHKKPTLTNLAMARLALKEVNLFRLISEYDEIIGYNSKDFQDKMLKKNEMDTKQFKMGFSAKRKAEMLEINDAEIDKNVGLLMFAHTKPPGTVILFLCTHKIIETFFPQRYNHQPISLFFRITNYLWPMISYLVLIPLFLYAEMFTDTKSAVYSCLLYIFLPAVNLFFMQLDQVFYPLFIMICLLTSAYGIRRDCLSLSFLSGAAVYCSLFFSISVLSAVPFIFISMYLIQVRYNVQDIKKYIFHAITLIAGFLSTAFLFLFLLKYNFIVRISRSMLVHKMIKNIDMSFLDYLYYSFLNLFEFSVWLSIPMAVLFIYISLRSMKLFLIEKNFSYEILFPILVSVILLLLSSFSQTKGEVGRLWILLMPLICFINAHYIFKLFSKHRAVLIFLLTLQGVTVFIFKLFQDFI